MRPKGDNRLASEFKGEKLEEMISKGLYDTHIAIDDDPFLVPVYLKLRIFPLLAPQCWDYIAQLTEGLPQETSWRK
jgi:hypothetical protein